MELLNLQEHGITSPMLSQYGVVSRGSVLAPEELTTPVEATGERPALIKTFSDAEGSQVAGFRKEIDEENRRLNFIASAKTVDRDRDVILPSAYKGHMKYYRRNPVMPWAHDTRFPPVARSSDWLFTDELFTAVANFGRTPFADEIFSLYIDGILNAFSVGFLSVAIDTEPIMAEQGQTGWTFTKVELLEISCVTVPSNREALVERGQKHLRGLVQAVKSIRGDTEQKLSRVKIASDRFGVDLSQYERSMGAVPDSWPEGEDVEPEASGKAPSKKEARMFKVYSLPKSPDEALSNVFSKFDIKLEEGVSVEEFIKECHAAATGFQEAEPPAIPKQVQDALGKAAEASEALVEVCKAVGVAVEGKEADEAEEAEEEVVEGPGDGSEEVEAAEEPDAGQASAPEAEGGDPPQGSDKSLNEDERQELIEDAFKALDDIQKNPDLSDAEKEAEAEDIRKMLTTHGVELEPTA